MQDNLNQMVIEMVAFLVANAVFMIISLYYLAAKTDGVITIGSRLEIPLRRADHLKICCIFAALYFVVYISIKHSWIECEDLEKVTQCQCYALEVIHTTDLQEKIEWAYKGSKVCPDSTFFSKFLEQNM